MLPRMWDPFEEMDDMFRFPSLLRAQTGLAKGFVPAMDMYETDGAVMVEMPLAGVDAKDVEVSVEKGVLTVKGNSKKEHEVDDKDYYRKEVRSGSFFRQVSLPVAVKEGNVSAESEDGMLKIKCPKAAPSAPKKVNVTVKKKAKK